MTEKDTDIVIGHSPAVLQLKKHVGKVIPYLYKKQMMFQQCYLKMNAFSLYTVLRHDYGLTIKRPYLENGEWVVDWGSPKDNFINFPEEFTIDSDFMLELLEKELKKEEKL